MRLSELKIDPDFRDCLPKLTDEEFEQLERNIVEYGVQMPLIIWNGYVVDGHNRYTVCFNHGIKEVPVREEYFESKDDALRWILENQLGRRNLTGFARDEIALRYKEIIARKAKVEGDKKRSENYVNRYSLGQGSYEPRPKKDESAAARIAEIAGTNPSSVKRTEFILKNGTAEEIERARHGGTGNSQGTIVREIKKRIAPAGTKVCGSCGEVKPIEEFRVDNSKRDGLSSVCNDCHNEQNRTYSRKKQDDDVLIGEIVEEMYSDETKPYTSEMLVNEVAANSENYVSLLRNMIEDRSELLDAETKRALRETVDNIISNIVQIQEELL